MTSHDLNARLKSLFESNRGVSHLTTKLLKFSVSNDPQSDNEARIELSAEIHQRLKELEEDFELVKQEAEVVVGGGDRKRDTAKERERVTIVTQVERLAEDLKLLVVQSYGWMYANAIARSRLQFQKAQLQAKSNAEAAKRKERREEREALFAGIQEGNTTRTDRRKGQEKLTEDQVILNASNDVTSALRRTHQLMQSELQRSQFAHETLQRSTAALNALNESYSTLDNILASSKSLIGTLVSSNKSDTWYLENAFRLVLFTLGWLFFRRVLWYPAKLFVILPTKWSLSVLSAVVQVALGIFTGTSRTEGAVRSPSTSLVIQPSATGRPPANIPGMAAPAVRVGAGGEGAKRSQDGKESLTDEIGRMTEESKEKEQKNQEKAWTSGETAQDTGNDDGEDDNEEEDDDDEDEGERSGTVLRPRRDDEKPNPKKRMFEDAPNPKKRMWEEPIAPKEGEEHDEL